MLNALPVLSGFILTKKKLGECSSASHLYRGVEKAENTLTLTPAIIIVAVSTIVIFFFTFVFILIFI